MTTHIRQFLQISLIALISTLIIRPIDNWDVWWHLNAGLWMLNNAQLMDTDIWSYTQHNNEWLNIAWIFQIIIALCYKLGSEYGLLTVKAVFTTAILTNIYYSQETKNPITYILAILVFFPSIFGYLHLRPNLVELLGISIIILLSQFEWNKKHVIIAFITLLAWSNSHGSAIVGVCALSIYSLFGRWQTNHAFNIRIFSAILFSITLFLTPYTFKIIDLLFAHGHSENFKYYISEWNKSEYYPDALWMPAFITLSLFATKKLKISLAELFLIAFFLYMSHKHVRFEIELAILLIRPVSQAINLLLYPLHQYSNKTPLLTGLTLTTIFILMHKPLLERVGIIFRQETPYAKHNYPSTTIDQALYTATTLGRPVKIFNEFRFGGYIGFRAQGKALVYIDGRMSSLYPESLLIAYNSLTPAFLLALAERYNVDHILLELDKTPLLGANNNEWVITSYDAASVLFTRRTLANSLNLPEIQYLPNVFTNIYPNSETEKHLDATESLLNKHPDNSTALIHKAFFLAKSSEYKQSRDSALYSLNKAETLQPHESFSTATKSYFFILWSDKYPNSPLPKLDYTPPTPDQLHENIPVSYDLAFSNFFLKRGTPKAAKKYLYPESSNNRRETIDANPDTWILRTLTHSQLGELREAYNCLTIAKELIKDDDSSRHATLRELEQKLNTYPKAK